jgi:TP901 family phage tail tape measure protein
MANETIVTNIVANANFSSLIANVQKATAELAQLKGALATTNKALAMDAAKIQQGFSATLRSTGQFSTHFVSLSSDVEKFGKNLDQGRLKLKDYYRTFQDHTRTSGGMIRELARQQVQLQNAILQPLGRNAEGLMQFNVQIPRGLDATKNRTALLKQEMQIFNKVIQDGGVQLINWGKNTQWAGRQLTVGLTVPITAFGIAASKAFREADEQLVRLTKVYGGVAQTSATELAKVRKEVSATARELAAAYGASYKETIALAADIAATGKQGDDLIRSTQETTRLSILGEVDRQEAMKATLAIQTAFKQNTTELSESINFLNAVENQTSTSLADLVEAIPKAGPVIQSLGGSVQDLALYLTAMKEGGVNASEGANAIKSSLASLINPTKVAKEMFQGFGIDLENIVTSNAGNLTGMMLELQSALDKLDPLSKSKAIEQLFGKFQFARLSALFENLGKEGSQTLQVLDLMKTSTQDLANIANRELTQITESASGKYKRALESLKASLAGVGEQFLNIGTFFINIIDKVVQFANKLPDPIKKLLTFAAGFTALTGPIIMLTGVLANFLGYVVKGAAHFRALFKGGEGWKLLTPEILAANKAGNLLETTFYSDAKAATVLSTALHNLNEEFRILQARANSGVSAAPTISTVAGQVVMTGTAIREVDPTSRYISPRDTRAYSHPNPVSAMTPAEREAQTIFGIVPGAPKVNNAISNNPQMYMSSDLPKVAGVSAIKGVSTGIVAGEAAKWHAMTGALAMQSEAEIALLKREVAATGLITTSLSDSYQALLPQMSRITTLAATESAEIVAQLQASKITVDQARARVVALNRQIEMMMGQAATEVATAQGRTINLTQLPLVDQPAFDPVTGKANMKELTRPGRTRTLFNSIARVLGVKTYGAPYSIETTRPKRFNVGGDIESFGPNKTVVSGPSSINYDDRFGNVPLNGYVLNQQASLDPRNKDLVDAAPSTFSNSGSTMKAMLTPKETIFGPGIHRDPELYAAVDAANNGYAFGGDVSRNKKNYGLNPASLIANYLARSSMIGGGRSPGTRYWRASRNRWDTTGSNTQSVSEPGSGSIQYSSARSRSSAIYSDETNKRYGITPTKRGDVLVHAFPPAFVRRLESLGYGPEDQIPVSVLRSLGVSVPQGSKLSTLTALSTTWVKNTSKFNQRIKGDGSPARTSDGKGWKDSWREVGWQDMQSLLGKLKDIGVPEAQAQQVAELAASRLNALVERRNGLMNEAMWGQLVNSAEIGAMTRFSRNSSSTPFAANLGGMIPGGNIQRGRYGYGVPSLASSAIARLTARWKPQERFRMPGYQYTLGNQDPLHGPLQIGRTMVPKDRQDDYEWTREVIYQDDRFARQNVMRQFPIGSEEERGKYILRQYMAGNYGILQTPGATELMKKLSRKFSGTLYRGLKLSKNRANPLPQNIIEAIDQARLSGDPSGLIGQEFIMRRSSWSKNRDIASLFAPGHGASADGSSILIEASVKNRNVVPASDIFPDAKFSAPFGQKVAGHNSRSEQESIFGGKFRVVGYENGTLKLETVVDGTRAMGGPVNANRPYLVGENGPEIFVPRNSGGIIPGGDIVKNRTGYGLPAIPTMPGYETPLATQMGMTPITKGSSGINPYGAKAQVFSMATAVGGGVAGQAMGGNTGFMIGSMLGQVASILPFLIKGTLTLSKVMKFAGFGLAVTSAIALGKVLLDLKKKYEDAGKANRLAFGANEKTLGEAGLSGKYKDLSTRLKDINAQLDLQRAKASASYDSNTKTGISGLTFTIKELREETARVKKEMPETLAAFNNIDSSKVNQLATSLKSQYVSMGMSVQQATNKIYALIAASNKSGQSVSAISSDSFKQITDRASAAAASVKMVSNAIVAMNGSTSKGFLEELNTGVENMINVLSTYQDSLVGSKGGEDGKTQLTEADALKQTLDEIGKIKGATNEIDKKTLDGLKQQNLVYATILKNGETLQSIYAKTAIYAAGLADKINIAAMTGKQAVDFARQLAAYQGALNEVTSSTDSNNPLSALAKLYDAAKKASENAIKAQKAAAKFDADYYKDKIKAIQKVIDQLEKERNARLKLLDVQQAEADFAKSLKEEQIRYQEFLAAGDLAAAAQSQLNIKKLQEDRQRQITRESISNDYEKRIEQQNKEIERLQKILEDAEKNNSTASSTAAKKSADLATIADFRARINDIVTRNPGGNFSKSDEKLLIQIFNEMREAGGSIKKAADEMLSNYPAINQPPSQAGGKPVAMSPELQLAQALAKAVNDNKNVAFASAVDKFILAVDKFAGATSGTGSGTKEDPFKVNTATLPKVAPGGTTAAEAAPLKSKDGTITKAGLTYIIETNKYQKGKYFEVDGVKYVVESGHDAIIRPSRARKLAMGGYATNYDGGGNVSGPGTSTSDSIPAMLSDGEWVIKADSVKKAEKEFGPSFLHDLNAGRFANGGKVSKMRGGKESTLGTVDSMIKAAESMLGYKEGKNNDTIFGRFAQKAYDLQSRYIAWCGAFINWAAKNAGVDLASMIWTPGGAQSFMKSGKWTKMNPKRGDLAFMDFPGDGVNRISHVGLVRNVLSSNAVSTIEGNTSGSGSQRSGGGVHAKVRQYNMKNAPIVGFGRPSYKPVDNIKYGYGTQEYYSADDAKSDYENSRYTVNRGDTLSGIAAKYGITVKQLMAMNPQLNDPKYMGGSRIFSGTKVNIKKFAEGGKVVNSLTDSGNWIKGPLTVPRQRKPGVPYSRSGRPIGNPFGQYWGELSRFIGPRSPGMDIWGGTEIPGLKFSGSVPQHSDYMHQMLEQPRKPFASPGMGIDRDPMRLAGSGASTGGIGNGAYGLGPLMFHAGGPVGHTHSGAPHSLGMSSMGSVSAALKQKMESSSDRRSGRRRLPAGHMASNYKAPKSVAQKIYDNFLFPAILSLDRVQAAFTGTNPIASTNIEGLKSQQEKIKQQGVKSVLPEIAAQVGLDFGSFLLPAAAGNASIRGLAEGYGLSKGLPGLGSLLPKGSIPYATSAVPKFTSNAITAAIIGASRPFAENKISSMIQKPQVKISSDDFKPNNVYPPFVIHEGKNVPVHSGSGFGNDAVVFQGRTENLSSLLASHQVTDIIPTTPEGILSYILKKDPNHTKARRLLDKMDSGYQWGDREVKEFLMNMLASGSINLKKVDPQDLASPHLFGLRRPELSESLDPAGLAQLISAMRGNTRDDVAIKTKTKAISPLLTKMVQEYIENVRLQQEAVAANIARQGGPRGGLHGVRGEKPLTKKEIADLKARGWDPSYTPLTPRDIPMIRIFNDDFPSTDGKGDLFEKDAATHILSRFFGPKGLPEGTVGTLEQLAAARTSRHFGIYDAVQSHMQGEWKPDRPFIVSTLSNLMKYNGKPEQLHSVDSYFLQRFGKPFHYSKKEGELSSGFPLEESDYIAKLKELNLYKDGEEPPIIAEDFSAKEIFYLAKEKYSQSELAQILQAVNENGNLKPIARTDNAMGGSHSEEFYMPARSNYESDEYLSASRILQILAIDKAKKQIGIDEKYRYAVRGEFSSLNKEEIAEMAANLGVRFDGGHNASDIDNLAHGSGHNPFEYILNAQRAQTGDIGVGISDTQKALGALLMFTRFGKYTSGKTYADEKDLLAVQKSAVGLYARGALSEKDFMSIISDIKEQLKNVEEAAGGGFVNNGKIQIPKFANGGIVNTSFNPKMSIPGFANGGMASPTYNIPTSTVGIASNQVPGYNKGGSIHHYNAGGIVVNGAQGQDVKELANHIVNIMDARGARRQSMTGGGITV